MEHHKTIMYQEELRSIKAVICYANVSRLLDFVGAVANPFIIKASGVRLNNFATEHFINDEIMDMFENGAKIQKRELVLKTKKLAVTIHICNVTCRSVILSVIETKSNRASYTIIPKLLGYVERDIEIARVRGITLAEVFSRVGEHRGLVLEKVHAFTANDVTCIIGTKHAAMQCNPIVYLIEFDDRAELPYRKR